MGEAKSTEVYRRKDGSERKARGEQPRGKGRYGIVTFGAGTDSTRRGKLSIQVELAFAMRSAAPTLRRRCLFLEDVPACGKAWTFAEYRQFGRAVRPRVSPACERKQVPRRGGLWHSSVASMRSNFTITLVLALVVMAASCRKEPAWPAPQVQTYSVTGLVTKLVPTEGRIVVRHQAVPGYMDAMTMPFNVRDTNEVAALRQGDEIAFRLHVTDERSWIDGLKKLGSTNVTNLPPAAAPTNTVSVLDYRFTNELGRTVSLREFQGQVLAITFIFTRCPVPDYCPRLSKNFEEASQKLLSKPGAPTNWHLISVSFDPEHDSPAVLLEYAKRYRYDPAHWTFLTGAPEPVAELAKMAGVSIEREGDLFNHGFRTLIIDPTGRVQMSYPIGGNLSDFLVEDILKAAAVTNR
jgi:protein SCO1